MDLLNGFSKYNCLLFLGRRAKLSKDIARLPWSTVITSINTADFGDEFLNDNRRVKKNLPITKKTRVTFDRKNLLLTQIYGTEDSKIDPPIKNYIAQKIIENAFEMCDVRTKIVIAGYDSSDEREFPCDLFHPLLNEIRASEVYFFDCVLSKEIIELAHDKGFEVSPNPIDEIFDNGLEDYSEDFDLYDDNRDNYIFYKGGKVATIKRSILTKYSHLMQLLTEESVNIPIPDGERSIAYYNFLNDSSFQPQWYGYKAGFCLKRDFEDLLTNLIINVARGDLQKGHHTPIILCGEACSSKSMTLAASAYKIYSRHINPVVYIHNDSNAFLDPDTDEFNMLHQLLYEIEHSGAKDLRTVIFWDCASYKNGDMVNNLCRLLTNKGRSFTLVATSYGSAADKYENPTYYRLSDKKIVKTNSSEDAAIYSNGTFYIQTSQTLSDSEKKGLLSMAQKLSPRTNSSLWERLKKDTGNSIFVYFYNIVSIIRPNLRARLSRELCVVTKYIEDHITSIKAIKDGFQGETVMQKALREAGLSKTDIESDTSSYSLNFERFELCLALFGRFNLSVPCQLAFHFLETDNDDIYNNRELFNLLTTLPWVRYTQVGDDGFVFFYRNALEASIFLQNKEVDPLEEIDLICDSLEYWLDFQNNTLKTVLLNLLNIIGPNTKFGPFLSNGQPQTEHNNFLQHLEKIIDKLNQIWQELHDIDFAIVEITFIREYYGKLYDRRQSNPTFNTQEILDPNMRIKKLEEAIEIAQSCEYEINKVKPTAINSDKNRYNAEINFLSVEIALTSLTIKKMDAKPAANEQRESSLSYFDLQEKLQRVIISNPTDGYAYNACFGLFEYEYENSHNDKKKQLELLTRVSPIVDDAITLVEKNRGANNKDEIGLHIMTIQNYRAKYSDITINSIKNNECESTFMTLFNNLLNQGRAAPIIFVCQQELIKNHLDCSSIRARLKEQSDYRITDHEKAICQNIIDFMDQKVYQSALERDPYALYLKLQLLWMRHNGTLWQDKREVQPTFIDKSGWEKIKATCEMYESCNGGVKQPKVFLIHALSILQLTFDYNAALDVLDLIDEDSDLFGFSRMKVPYVICDSPGHPKIYNGTVTQDFRGLDEANRNNGRLQISGVMLDKKRHIRFRVQDIDRQNVPPMGEMLNDLILALGYTGLSAYTESGRQKRECIL